MANDTTRIVGKDTETASLAEEILDVIMAISTLDFSTKVTVGYGNSGFNAVAMGLNKLSEELQRSVVSKQVLEEEVAKRIEELSEREKKYRNIFDNTSVAIIEQGFGPLLLEIEALKRAGISDFKTHALEYPNWIPGALQKIEVVDANAAAVEMFEAPDKDQLIAGFRELFTSEGISGFQNVLLGLAVGKLDFDFETVSRTFGGNLLNIMIQIRIPEEELGSGTALVSIVNLTSQRDLENQLRQSQKMESLGRLAGGVAHDFNNLLTVILNYGQMVLDELAPADPIRKKIHAIVESADRAAALTKQLLAFSRKQVVEAKSLDINGVLETMEGMLIRLLGEHIELINHANSPIGSINADANLVEQIILNLAVNARDAMPGGGKLILETHNMDVEADLHRDHSGLAPGPYVMLAVSDTGEGMSESVRSRIFEPFFTTKMVGKGTGLGLATVYGNVKRSNGHIIVYSEVGQGSTFKIYFPRVETHERASLAHPATALQKILGGHETILVVEDEERVRAVAVSLLREKGYRVIEAGNGVEGLERAQEEKGAIHLLLSDVIMPQMNGRHLAEKMAVLRPDTKVVFMSGYTDNVIAANGNIDKGSSFIQKPFSSSSLLGMVRDKLDGKC